MIRDSLSRFSHSHVTVKASLVRTLKVLGALHRLAAPCARLISVTPPEWFQPARFTPTRPIKIIMWFYTVLARSTAVNPPEFFWPGRPTRSRPAAPPPPALPELAGGNSGFINFFLARLFSFSLCTRTVKYCTNVFNIGTTYIRICQQILFNVQYFIVL